MKPAEMGKTRRSFTFFMTLTLVFTAVSCNNHRFTAERDAGPRPIAVLTSANPLDAGQATPQVAVYEDGRVIFTSWKNAMQGKWQYLTYQLAPSALSVFRRRIHEVVALNSLRSSYEALDERQMVMDASYAQMYLRDGRHEAAVSVYALGYVLHSDKSSGWKPTLRPYEQGGPPPQLLSLYRELEAQGSQPASLAEQWNPQHVEVRLRDDAKHIDRHPVSWPAGWPAPGSKSARPSGDHTWYVLLEGAEIPRVRRLLPSDSEEKAVLIDGKIWFAYWRPVLPLEGRWLEAMKRSRK